MAAVVEAKDGEVEEKESNSEIPDAANAPKPPHPGGPKPPKAPPPARLLAARKGFDGLWVKEFTSSQFTIDGERVILPDGNIHEFINLGSGTCQLSMETTDGRTLSFKGSFASEDKIKWFNGSTWIRATEQQKAVSGQKALGGGSCATNGHGVLMGGGAAGTKQAVSQAWSIWGRAANAATLGGNATVGASSSSPASATSSTASASKPTPQNAQVALKSLTGTWKKVGTESRYRIEGTSLHWLDSGKTYSIKHCGADPQFPSCPRFLANIESTAFVATLRSTQQLVWSNGGVWQREADLDTPPVASSPSLGASKATAAVAGDAENSVPSKPTIVHGKDGDAIGKKIDQLLGLIGAKEEDAEPSVAEVSTSSSTAPEPAPSTAPAASSATPLTAAWAKALKEQHAVAAPVPRPTAPAQHVGVSVGAGYAAAYHQVAKAQQAQQIIAQQAVAHHLATLVAGSAAAQAALQANRAADTAAGTSTTTSAPASSVAPTPPTTPGPQMPTASSAVIGTSVATETKVPVASETTSPSKASAGENVGGSLSSWREDAQKNLSPSADESVGDSLSSWREDALKNLSATSKSAEAIMKLKDTNAKEAERKKEAAKVKDTRDSKAKEKELKDVKPREREPRDAKEGRARERHVKATAFRSRSRHRSRSRGIRNPRRGTSRSWDRNRLRDVRHGGRRGNIPPPPRRRSPSPRYAKRTRGRDVRDMRQPSRTRGREPSRNKRRTRNTSFRSRSPRRSRSPVMPFVPRQLRGKFDVQNEARGVSVASASRAAPQRPEGRRPVPKSAPRKPAQHAIEGDARLSNREMVTEEGDDLSDGEHLMKGRWRLEVTDSEDDLETNRDVRDTEEQGFSDMDDASSRLDAICEEVSPPAKHSPPEGKVSLREVGDDDDMEDDAAPLPEISELRARAQAIGEDHENTSGTQDDPVGKPPVVADADRRKEQVGVVEEALSMEMQDPKAHVPSNDIRRVRVTSTRGREVNLVAVMGFCANFGKVVAMKMEGSGAEACAIIEYNDGAAAHACVNQRDSEALHVALCDD